MKLREPNWDAWWGLLDTIEQHPNWIRVCNLASADQRIDDTYIQRFMGKDWVTVATIGKGDFTATVYGYFKGDEEALIKDEGPEFEAEEPPLWLLGMEE